MKIFPRTLVVRLSCAIVLATLFFGGLPIAGAEAPPTGAALPDNPFPASPTFTLLSGLTTNVILPSLSGFSSNLTLLARAVDKFVEAQDTNALRAARESWKAANSAWRLTESFQLSLDGELSLASRVSSWPIRPASVQALLNGSKPINDALLTDEVGVSVLGLGTVEWLLFAPLGEDARVVAMFQGVGGARRRAYLSALTRDLLRTMTAIQAAYTSGDNDFRARFAVGGQDSLNTLVNRIIEALEVGVVQRLQRIADLQAANRLSPEVFEGGISSTSQRDALQVLRGAQLLFQGGQGPGLGDFLRLRSAPIADQVMDSFSQTTAAVDGIGTDIASALKSKPAAVNHAISMARSLEVLLKVDVISALGLNLTFSGNDSD